MRYLGVTFAKAMFGKVYADLALMEDVLRSSGLDWTVLRPPQLTNKPLTDRYFTAYGHNVRGGFSAPRADVAHFMLAVLDQQESIGQVIGIASYFDLKNLAVVLDRRGREDGLDPLG